MHLNSHNLFPIQKHLGLKSSVPSSLDPPTAVPGLTGPSLKRSSLANFSDLSPPVSTAKSSCSEKRTLLSLPSSASYSEHQWHPPPALGAPRKVPSPTHHNEQQKPPLLKRTHSPSNYTEQLKGMNEHEMEDEIKWQQWKIEKAIGKVGCPWTQWGQRAPCVVHFV